MSKSRKKIEYLTKRLLISKSDKAIQIAAENAMKVAGYVVIVRDGKVVKEYQDGTVEIIEELDTSGENLKLILD